MARLDNLQGSLPLLVLKILAKRGKLHGYALTSVIEEMSDEVLRVEQGSLYPALHRMEEEGWIAADWVTTENNRKARVYAITPEGKKRLQEEEARWNAVITAVGHVLKRV